ncbi:hypothetical protein C1645_836008 [Glomus cerebriforme]|uniref:Uncharacterized protein n=1 Tax=Glomus cerebriforme TaxID=658196 RepID=A0A397SAY7_9GLOM|nr:hypothetical protein C1645_836008 [Glomus cerebriforme]
MTTRYRSQSTYEEERKERKAKLIILVIIGMLTAAYGNVCCDSQPRGHDENEYKAKYTGK